MEQEWILDVIADLRTFARQNGLQNLADQLDTTWVLAAAEIAPDPERVTAHERGPAAAIREHPPLRRNCL